MKLYDALKKHPSQKAAIVGPQLTLSYGALLQSIRQYTKKLESVGVLGIALDNVIEWVLWDLAAQIGEVVAVPIPLFFTKAQMDHIVQQAGITHIATGTGLLETKVSSSHRLFEETAKITFTSGSTGAPKGVCLPQKAIDRVSESLLEMVGDEYAGNHVCVLPLCVLLENIAGVYTALRAGSTVHVLDLAHFGANFQNLHEILKQKKATTVILVPELLRVLIDQTIVFGQLPDIRLIAVGGSKIDSSLILKAHALGLPVYEGYGLSECVSVLTLNTPSDYQPGSVGKPLPHTNISIIEGEIVVNQPGFLGYIDSPATEIFKTGDLGYFEKQFLRVTGRKKNVLITSYGRNISPEWVESVLLAQPEIGQAIVYGDGQPSLSAIITLTSKGGNIKAAIEKANFNLPNYAQIFNYSVVDTFTVQSGLMTGTGKPCRDKILKAFAG